MKYLCGTPRKLINKIYIYRSKKYNKIHIRGKFKDYLYSKGIKFLKIAYREQEDNIIYFIPHTPQDKFDKKHQPAKISFQIDDKNTASISCKTFFDRFRFDIPVKSNGSGKYQGHNVPYEIFEIDFDRLAIRVNLLDIEREESEKEVSYSPKESNKEEIFEEEVSYSPEEITREELNKMPAEELSELLTQRSLSIILNVENLKCPVLIKKLEDSNIE